MKICSVCQRCYEDSIESCTQGNHGSPAVVRPGTREVIPGYRLNFLLDRDAAGQIYAANRLADDEPFVIKLISLQASAEAQNLRERFQTEARLALNINHRNLVRVYETGLLENGEFFIVSESVSGKTLREYLRNDGALSEAVAIAIARQAAEGLEAAHVAGLTHRAVSPSNIIITQDNQARPWAKVQNFDFGGIGQQTAIAGVSGSNPLIEALRYMSPEQYTGQMVNARTDIYSLGVVLFEMIAGRSPFDAPTPEAIIHKPINEQPLERLGYETKALVTHTLRLSLQKNPTARPQTAANFARQLRHIEQVLATSSISLQNNLPSNKPAPVDAPVVSSNAPEPVELTAEKSQPNQTPNQTPVPIAAAPVTTNSLVLPTREDSDIEEDTLVRTTPIFQSELIAVKKKEANPVSFAPETIPVKRKDINAEQFASEPIRIKKKEVYADSFVAEPISVKRKEVEIAQSVSESVAATVPAVEVTRAAQQPTQSFLNSFEDNYAKRRPGSNGQSLLVGVGLVALLALAGLSALLYNRQPQQTAVPPTIAAASPSASPQSEEVASAPKDYAAENSNPLQTGNPASVDKTSTTVSESRKKIQPRTEMPVNNTATKQTEPVKEVSTVEKPAVLERGNQSDSGEASNEGGAAQTELNTSLDKWVTATKARDINQQMNYYAPKVDAFYRTRNASQDAVRAEKKRVFDRADAVDIQTSKPEIALSPDGRSAKMRFRKKYVIKQGQQSRSGEVIQELQWVKSNAGWKIVSERDVKVVNR